MCYWFSRPAPHPTGYLPLYSIRAITPLYICFCNFNSPPTTTLYISHPKQWRYCSKTTRTPQLFFTQSDRNIRKNSDWVQFIPKTITHCYWSLYYYCVRLHIFPLKLFLFFFYYESLLKQTKQLALNIIYLLHLYPILHNPNVLHMK